MFSEMVATIRKNQLPDTVMLQKRFDYAMTKKLGVLNLPPPFWMQDPKINPPAGDLFWASLLLKDRERINLAMSVIAAELNKSSRNETGGIGAEVKIRARQLAQKLLMHFSDMKLRNRLRQDLSMIVPDILGEQVEGESRE